MDYGLAPDRRQAIMWTYADPIHRRIYEALGEDELNDKRLLRSWQYMAWIGKYIGGECHFNEQDQFSSESSERIWASSTHHSPIRGDCPPTHHHHHQHHHHHT